MIQRFFLLAAGYLSLLAGVIGLILPLLPGWPLIFFGLSIIAPAVAFRLKYKINQAILKKDIIYFSEWKKSGVDAGITTKFFPFRPQKIQDMDVPEKQEAFRRYFSQSPVMTGQKIPLEGRFAWLHQVHGGKVAVLERGVDAGHPGFFRLTDTDGAITNVPGLTLLAMTADCLSVYFRAPGWVGVAHAGWRGTSAQIAVTAANLLMEKSGCRASDIHVIFGPSICGRHYEVGPEFKKHFAAPALRPRGGRLYLDLVRENAKQLRQQGILLRHFSDTALCTVCENRHFYSFRKEKESAARMISFIQLRA